MKQPQGILLTPGTATSRRKRVSFKHDALTTTKSISPFDGPRDGVVKRTRLSEALDKARRPAKTVDAPQPKAETDSDWEEEGDYDDGYDEDVDGDVGAQDFTLDLNEPHSQSGKYWKGEFERYRSEAAAELEKLVKYKQRAKSYAREKDVEAMQLAEKLREEQEKVVAMEKKIAENASQMAAKQRESCSIETAELLATLTQQTALATKSRHRVQELEEQLEDLLQGRDYDDDDDDDDNDNNNNNNNIRGRRRRTSMPSSATQKTLLETQRELRRARTQLKELDDLRVEVSSLKAQLRRAGQRGIAEPGVVDGGSSESSLVIELRAQLRQAKEESARKDEGFMQLKLEFEAFRDESEAHDADARAVLERANAKITDLKKQVKLLKATNPGEANRLRSWQLQLAGDRVSKDDLSVEIPSRRAFGVDYPRRSFDLADSESNGPLTAAKARTLREKYQEDETNHPRNEDDVVITAITPGVLADRPDLARPRWQPFVPRSPRNRAHAEGSLAKRVQSGAAPAAKSKSFAFPDLPGLKAGLRSKGPKPVDDGDLGVDLLQDRFARLGGPESDQERNKKSTLVLSANTRGSRIPPERRAAAIARIEKRMADRASRREGYDKENLRP
ncbi:hypothetical protein ESCO_006712 [Escovopsis weberi]|uniref:Spindle pole body-associated protein cut12 domain-containing protein n=1 Tax=Escovopsis weberi TaxID=150374 RepID=A0A0M8MXJ1_ESCWE|nr:hypothetical protein ESCO_006712 [Escovopsis weberi]